MARPMVRGLVAQLRLEAEKTDHADLAALLRVAAEELTEMYVDQLESELPGMMAAAEARARDRVLARQAEFEALFREALSFPFELVQGESGPCLRPLVAECDGEVVAADPKVRGGRAFSSDPSAPLRCLLHANDFEQAAAGVVPKGSQVETRAAGWAVGLYDAARCLREGLTIAALDAMTRGYRGDGRRV